MGTEVGNTKKLVMENEAAGYHELISQKEKNLHVNVLSEILYFVNFTLIKRLVLQIKIHCLSGKS